MFEDELENIMTKVGKFIVIITTIFMVFLTVRVIKNYNDATQRIQELENRVQELQDKSIEATQNINEFNKVYAEMWIKLYGEDSWYEKTKDKLKVQKEIESEE